MNTAALALHNPALSTGLPAQAAYPTDPLQSVGAPSAADAVTLTARLLRAACRRGQLEDASAAARWALPAVAPRSAHHALLRALDQAQPAMMVAPDESRIYLMRDVDGSALGLMRLRDNGQVVATWADCAPRWQLRDGDLALCDAQGQTEMRFALCAERDGARLYLGESVDDGAPRLLQEMGCTYARLRMLDPELIGPFCALFDAPSLVPAELPAQPALLLGESPRSNQALRLALNRSAAIFIDGDLLQAQTIGLAEGPLPTTSAGALYELRSKDPAWFARMMMNRSHDGAGSDLLTAAVRGFTLAPMHSLAGLDWAIGENRLRIVHVVRSNLLAEFADVLTGSLDFAATSGQALHFEAARFTSFVSLKQQSAANLRQRLTQRQADTVEVDASRLNAATLADLFDFLSDGSACAPSPSQTAAAPASRVIERFSNPEAVARCLVELGRTAWAEVEGQAPELG
jgi:hypothetical protein